MIPKAYAETGTGPVVAGGKAGRGTIVPIAIEREIIIELAPQLHVVGRVHIELNPSRIGQGGELLGIDGQRRLVEAEEF